MAARSSPLTRGPIERRSTRKAYVCCTAAAMVIGCSTTPVDVGSYLVGSDEGPNSWTAQESCAGGPQLSIVGTWEGSIDNRALPSGSNAARLVITKANSARVCGTLTFGNDQPPWPPPTNPDVGYPADIDKFVQSSFSTYVAMLEGVPMTLARGKASAQRLVFRASFAQWRDWCALQTPYLCEGVATQEYYCVPASGSGGLLPRVRYTREGGCVAEREGGDIHVDCGKAALCFGGPCTCTAQGCSGPPLWGGDYDLVITDKTMESANLHLKKVR